VENLPTYLASRLKESEVAIYLFHGVIPAHQTRIRNYNRKHIEIDLFNLCLKSLMRIGNPLSMNELISIFKSNLSLPKNSFVITFDDGFENNYSVAMPVLVDYKIQPTIYVSTNFIETGAQSWTDMIEAAIEVAPTTELDFNWLDSKIVLSSDESRLHFLRQVRSYVKKNPEIDPYIFATELIADLDTQKLPRYDEFLDKKLSWAQVRDLHSSGTACIGGHGHTHRIMSFLSPGNLKLEIETSISLLKERAGINSAHYSYPEGLVHCFNDQVICELKRFGITCCPTAIDGTNQISNDLFHLRRIMAS
jgi:peptidoglycan/xylan/chitin deacetylase (PgdA/CDA1 family)